MLKHFTAATVALLLAAAALFAWYVLASLWPFSWLPFGSSSMRLDGPPFLASALLLAVSVIAFRRRADFPTILLLVGSLALFVARFHDVIVYTAVDYEVFRPDSFMFPGQGCVTENPLVARPMNVLRVAALSIPIALFWLAYTATKRHLTPMKSVNG